MEALAHRFFRYFPLEHARKLAKATQRVTYPSQRVIFEEGDASDVIYLVLAGRVEILKHSSGEHSFARIRQRRRLLRRTRRA